MPRLELHPEAATELEAAVVWYEQRQPGLGGLLLAEMDGCMKRICSAPDLFSLHAGTVRRCLLRKFPFAVMFVPDVDQVRVLAVMHLRRRPGYWKGREPESGAR
ncbi:MAG: type II toxin-antitoxin system RelE/ParE family toxin [Magnetococcales bacterium]|nr:type II toxin-antitoxin system RelE/ParE family toxin [Magnetococcales bacterium]